MFDLQNGCKINVRKVPVNDTVNFDNGKIAQRERNFKGEVQTLRPFSLMSSPPLFRNIAELFLENCFNSVSNFDLDLFSSVKRDMDIELQSILEKDYLHFFYLLGFFLDFYLETCVILG